MNSYASERLNIQREPSNYLSLKFTAGYKVIGYKLDLLNGLDDGGITLYTQGELQRTGIWICSVYERRDRTIDFQKSLPGAAGIKKFRCKACKAKKINK